MIAPTSTPRPITPLRQRTLDDMSVRGLSEDTRRDYIRLVARFAVFLGRPPDTATPDDVRCFQIYQRDHGAQPPTLNSTVSALRFFFTTTLNRPDLSQRLVVARYAQ